MSSILGEVENFTRKERQFAIKPIGTNTGK